MEQGFGVPNPLKIDLTGISHHIATSRPETCSSSRSTEFQTVMEGFASLQLHQPKPGGIETTKCIEENESEHAQLLQRRRSSTELTPGDMVEEFSQHSQRARRKLLPSLGLVARDIQYSVPSKRNSESYPGNLASDIDRSELHVIKEIPEKGARNPRRPSQFKGASKTSLSNQPGGSSNLSRRRRFSLGAQQNIDVNSNTALGFPTKQRRASCASRVENNFAWRVKVHQRSLNSNDDCDKSHSLYNQQLSARRTSLPSFSSFSGLPVSTNYSVIPRIGRRNSLVGEPDD